MIAFNHNDPHIQAYQHWREMVRAAKVWSHDHKLHKFFCKQAMVSQMEYETELAKLKGEQNP